MEWFSLEGLLKFERKEKKFRHPKIIMIGIQNDSVLLSPSQVKDGIFHDNNPQYGNLAKLEGMHPIIDDYIFDMAW